MIFASANGWKKWLIVTGIFFHICQAEIIGFNRVGAQHDAIERVADRWNRIRIKIVNLHFFHLRSEGPTSNREQTEHWTSNVQRWTSNNDVAPLRNLILIVFKNPMPNLEWLFLLLFSRVYTRTEHSCIRSSRSYVCFFIFSPSTFDVGRSMFDVLFFRPS